MLVRAFLGGGFGGVRRRAASQACLESGARSPLPMKT
jgi:hypothetical protein